MSQQYGPPPGPPPAPAPGWGTGPAAGGPGAGGPGGWGPGPGRPQQRPAKSSRNQWIIMICAVVAIALVAVGVVLLVTGGGKDDPSAQQTPDPVGTLYTPSPSATPNDAKGPNDQGIEVGWGVWFTPHGGWIKDQDKSKGGINYMLQQFNVRGLLDGYYWVRQTQLYDAKGFSEHLVDVETAQLKNVKIGKGATCQVSNPAIKACYVTQYTAVWVSKAGKQIPMWGFVTAYQDQFGRVTASDAALETRVYQRRIGEVTWMNDSLARSF
ncbi:hypothetical protein [Kribbella sp. NPDC055071]